MARRRLETEGLVPILAGSFRVGDVERRTAGALVGLYQARPELDTQGRGFAVASINALALSWNINELSARAAPDLPWSTYAQVSRVFHELRRLGSAQSSTTCLGHVTITPTTAKAIVTARYACPLSWRQAHAVAVVSLRKYPDAWKLTGFYISPPTPLAHGPKGTAAA